MPGEILPPVESGGYVKPKDHINHLVIVTEVHSSATKYDDVRKTDVEVLTIDFHCFNCGGTAAPERVMLGAPYVVSKVRRDGNLTLGYIQEMAPKPGYKDGAIILTEPQGADIPNAVKWWDNVKASAFKGPAEDPTTPPPADDPWATTPTATAAAPAAVAPTGPAWGAPAAAPATPTPPPAPAALPSFDEVKALPLVAVQALVSQGILTREQAAQAGHTV